MPCDPCAFQLVVTGLLSHASLPKGTLLPPQLCIPGAPRTSVLKYESDE